MRCPHCSKEINDAAKFCKHCGEDVIQAAVATATAPQPPPAPIGLHCTNCGVELQPNAKFCGGCGKATMDTPAPRQQIQRPYMRNVVRGPNRGQKPLVPEQVNSAIKNLSKGGKIAAIGGVAAFLGCLLPLESSSGMESAILPAIFKAMQYSGDAAMMLVLPLSAVAIAVMALCATSGSAHRRAMLGGAAIAVSSPWSVVFLIGLFAANKVMSALGGWGYGGSIGIGGFLLAAGFVTGVIGGFTIIKEAVLIAQRESGHTSGGSL